jgi:hypothetical protein
MARNGWFLVGLSVASILASAHAQSDDAPYLLPGPGLSIFCKTAPISFYEDNRLKSCLVSRDVTVRDTSNAPVICTAGMTAQFNERGFLLSCDRSAPGGGSPSATGIFGPAQPVPSSPPADPGGPFGPIRQGPPVTTGGGVRFLGWPVVCESAMTAILRSHQASFGPQAAVRVQWVRPLTFDGSTGDCMGGFRVYVRRPGDVSEWIALEWNAEWGTGRMAATTLVQQYRPTNPDLPWGPSVETPVSTSPTPVTSPSERGGICKSAMVAMEREKQAQWGSDGHVRYEWVKPFTYDGRDCVGGYRIWIRRPSDTSEFASSEWYAERGDGHVPAVQLVQQYRQKNPDLPWERPVSY